ncbi:hypothetical protein [Micrococcus luteus]|nr:hypothetical protein [Micrococcus luteus]
MRLGAVMVPLNPLFTARELEYFLEDSGAHALGHARAAGRGRGGRERRRRGGHPGPRSGRAGVRRRGHRPGHGDHPAGPR